MNPECNRCKSQLTRRMSRNHSWKDRVMYFIGMYPWECIHCRSKFFSTKRYNSSKRNAMGEVYTGSKSKRRVSAAAEEHRSDKRA